MIPDEFHRLVAEFFDDGENLRRAADPGQIAAIGCHHGQAAGVARRADGLEGADCRPAEGLDGRQGDAAGLDQRGGGFVTVPENESQGLGPGGDIDRALFAVDGQQAGDLLGMGAGLLDQVEAAQARLCGPL